MNAHQPVALLVPPINPIDRVDDLLNGAAGKLIAKHVERDFFGPVGRKSQWPW